MGSLAIYLSGGFLAVMTATNIGQVIGLAFGKNAEKASLMNMIYFGIAFIFSGVPLKLSFLQEKGLGPLAYISYLHYIVNGIYANELAYMSTPVHPDDQRLLDSGMRSALKSFSFLLIINVVLQMLSLLVLKVRQPKD